MNNIYPKCAVCGNVPKNGMFDGLWLAGRFLCSDCERRIVYTDVQEEMYLDNIQCVRDILFGSKQIKAIYAI